MGEMASKAQMPTPDTALPGRTDSIKVSAKHHVSGSSTVPPFPNGTDVVVFGMGCFWGAERKLWRQKGVYSTQVGYAGGFTAHPTYRDVCSGQTGHAEVVRVVFYPEQVSFSSLLKVFWENHDPTQGMRQGNDVGTPYRSAIYACTEQQLQEALASKEQYQQNGRNPSESTSPKEVERSEQTQEPHRNRLLSMAENQEDRSSLSFCNLTQLLMWALFAVRCGEGAADRNAAVQ
ncbi:mitochondrial peptide methionine sulfoxide reductase isoform X3 [Betta splendens]|nr:mitochondrial peptide methionine sulfoxide reductase isoform X3 [Betta splendens]